MTQVTTKTHPTLTAAERRQERARTEGAAYKIVHSELRLRRKSDGRRGVIRFALVTSPKGNTYTVRLRNNGDPCRCSCLDYARRQERDGAAVEPCKHMAMVAATGGQDQEPAPVVRPLPPAPFGLDEAQAELGRLERAERDRCLWD